MAGEGPKLAYVAAQFRVRVEFSRAHAMASEAVPADLMDRAKKKIESVKAEGKITQYVTYEKKLQAAWAAMRAATTLPPETVIGLTVAAGAPDIQGITVEKGDNEKVLAYVSVKAPLDLAVGWLPEWVKVTLHKKFQDLGLEEAPNGSQLQGMILRILRGAPFNKTPLSPAKNAAATLPKGTPFSLTVNRALFEVSVIIADLKPLSAPAGIMQLMASIKATTTKLGTDDKCVYQVLQKELMDCVKAARSGPELVGVGMPMIVLAATGEKISIASTIKPGEAAAPDTAAAAPGGKPANTVLNFTVTPDKMAITITGFDAALYDDPKIKWDTGFVDKQLQAYKYIVNREDDEQKALEKAIDKKEDLNEMVVSEAIQPVAATEPFLHPAYLDAPKTEVDQNAKVDIRESQKKSTVNVGDIVAVIQFKKPGQPGKNVLGQPIQPPDPERPSLNLGEGVEEKSGGKIVATQSGLPKIEGVNVSVDKLYVHEGDVNLKTGNIRFEGPVEIKGSVDSGASVDVKGKLIIRGMVRAGFVQCGDTVEVDGGINTTDKGWIRAKNDIVAPFIENSVLYCGGSVKAQKSIVNCEVLAGVDIIVEGQDGILAGGTFACRNAIRTANLGFKNGAATTATVGVDFRIQSKISLRNKRVEKFRVLMEDFKKELREITQKGANQLTQRHIQRREALKDRIIRSKPLLEKLEAALTAAHSQLTFDPKAKILVSKLLVPTCNITVAGNGISLPTEMVGVAILGRKRKDSFITSIEDAQAAESAEKIQAKNAETAAAEAKAADGKQAAGKPGQPAAAAKPAQPAAAPKKAS